MRELIRFRRNARDLLDAAEIADYFDCDIDKRRVKAVSWETQF
jgi:hypothetical protein